MTWVWLPREYLRGTNVNTQIFSLSFCDLRVCVCVCVCVYKQRPHAVEHEVLPRHLDFKPIRFFFFNC